MPFPDLTPINPKALPIKTAGTKAVTPNIATPTVVASPVADPPTITPFVSVDNLSFL